MSKYLEQYTTPIMDFLYSSIAWVLSIPILFFVKRRKNLIVFYGRDGGSYSDNCKHFYAALSENYASELTSIYLTRDDNTCRELRSLGGKAEKIGTLRCWKCWLTAGTIVVDSVDWHKSGRYPLSKGARLVQLWHGVPLKHIQLTRFQQRLRQLPPFLGKLSKLQRRITGQFPTYDFFISTSKYIEQQAFSSAFSYFTLLNTGYPRNDILKREATPLNEYGADMNAMERSNQHKTKSGGTVGLYAPTFRQELEDPFSTGVVDLKSISASIEKQNVLLLVKVHPWMSGTLSGQKYPNIVLVDSTSDTYPLLRGVDFLITDYSSIFFDFLLINKPIIFFPYDLQSYLSNDRSMYFEYKEMTPGPKVYDTKDLRLEIEKLCKKKDNWKNERERIRKLAFTHNDSKASERLFKKLFPDLQNLHNKK